MQNKKQLIILSAELKVLSDYDNAYRTDLLRKMLFDIGVPFNSVRGYYDGHSEASFLVEVKNNAQVEAIKGFAFNSFEQESILYQETSGLCSLLFSDGKIHKLGNMHEVKESEAKENVAYTSFRDSNNRERYFVCK
jgi:hypothetical protein